MQELHAITRCSDDKYGLGGTVEIWEEVEDHLEDMVEVADISITVVEDVVVEVVIVTTQVADRHIAGPTVEYGHLQYTHM